MRGRGAHTSSAGLAILLAVASLAACWAGTPNGTGRLMVSYEAAFKATVKAAIIASGHTIVYDGSMCSVYTIKPNNATSGGSVTLAQVSRVGAKHVATGCLDALRRAAAAACG
jgi:hypothetical protein